MYNRYLPSGASYARVSEEDGPPPQAGQGRQGHDPGRPPHRGERPASWLSNALKALHLEGLDTGDVLLLLILLFLFADGDDLELLIALGLLLLLGLGGKDENGTPA